MKFDIAGRKGLGAFYDLNARLDSETLSLTAVGQADLGKRLAGPAGIAVTANTPSIERLSLGAVKGQANFVGRFNGDIENFTLRGDARGANVSLAGYTLGAVSGPVTLARAKGEIGIVTSLAGAGGRGQGYLAALLGSRPSADGDIAILKDGRILLKRVRANGAGLKVDASGSRGLLGGLSFKGKAELWNFGAAKLGGKGRLGGSWSADQGGEGKPWVFTVDARGTGLALGMAELDRLLGPAPRLRAKASLQPSGQVDVAEARLDGDKAFAKGAGRLGSKGELAFKLDWNAEGPFRVGPVEVAGKAKGTGAIAGSLSAPRADLTAQVDQIDVPRLPLRNAALTLTFMQRPGGGDGAFSLNAESPYGPARLRTDFAFTDGGVNLSGLDADAGGVKAQGAVALRRGRPSSADLVLAIGPGVLLTEGSIAGTAKVVDSAGGARATLNLTAKDAVLRDAAG
ncbi:MAG: translocation/assembly module TamB, partial [Caulobacteraceae bacterium]